MKFFFGLLALGLSLAPLASLSASNYEKQVTQSEIEDLNEQIKDLEDERDKYRARATRAQDQGDRLQFENGMLTDARRYWIAADAYNEVADKIDEQITALKKKRDELLQQKK